MGYNKSPIPAYKTAIPVEHGHVLVYKFKWVINKYLKSPFKSDCIDYDEMTPFLTRGDCIRKCVIQTDLKMCGKINKKALISEETELDLYGENFSADNQTQQCLNKIDDVKFCDNMCKHVDCTNQVYISNIVYNTNSSDNVTEFSLDLSEENSETIVERPFMLLEDYICNLFSIYSIIYGSSLNDILTSYYPKLEKYITKKFRKLRQLINFNPNTTPSIVSLELDEIVYRRTMYDNVY